MAVMWFAVNGSLFGIVVGGVLFSIGMSVAQAVIATVVGAVIAGVVLAVGTVAGVRSGLPTAALSAASAGLPGRIVSWLVLIARVAAAGALLALLSRTTTDALAAMSAVVPSIVVLGVLAASASVLAAFGYRVIVPALLGSAVILAVLVLVLVIATVPTIDLRVAATIGDGPAILVVSGAVIVASVVGVTWLLVGSDLGRYQHGRFRDLPDGSRRGGGLASAAWAVTGAVVPTLSIVAYGAILLAGDPATAQAFRGDPVAALMAGLPGWFTVPFVVSLALGSVSVLALAAYSTGFAARSIGLPISRPAATVGLSVLAALIGGAVVLSELGVIDLVRDVVTSAAVPIAAWAGILTGRMLRSRITRPFHIGWREVALLVVASAIGYGLMSASVSGLQWQGYLYTLSSTPVDEEVMASDLGAVVALLIGVVGALLRGVADGRVRRRGSHRERVSRPVAAAERAATES